MADGETYSLMGENVLSALEKLDVQARRRDAPSAYWSVRGVPLDVRAMAAASAELAGLSLADWLTVAVIAHARCGGAELARPAEGDHDSLGLAAANDAGAAECLWFVEDGEGAIASAVIADLEPMALEPSPIEAGLEEDGAEPQAVLAAPVDDLAMLLDSVRAIVAFARPDHADAPAPIEAEPADIEPPKFEALPVDLGPPPLEAQSLEVWSAPLEAQSLEVWSAPLEAPSLAADDEERFEGEAILDAHIDAAPAEPQTWVMPRSDLVFDADETWSPEPVATRRKPWLSRWLGSR